VTALTKDINYGSFYASGSTFALTVIPILTASGSTFALSVIPVLMHQCSF
jgi:hypothetical protein